MIIATEALQGFCRDHGIELDDRAMERLERYAAMLLDWNTRMNLTTITDPQGIAIRHFADSLSLLAAVELAPGSRLLDVGSGAGFPAIPLKISRPDLDITMLDSRNKRLVFLQAVLDALGLTGHPCHMRAEDGARTAAMREQYDIVTARAVANLRVLAEYCLPYVRCGGVFAAMKGPEGLQEQQDAAKAIELLGGKQTATCPLTLPDGSERYILIIEKIRLTPADYPRTAAKITRSPL